MNRVTKAADGFKVRVLAMPESWRSELDKQLVISYDEWLVWMDTQAWAKSANLINLEEAMTIYEALGASGPDKFAKQPIEMKIVLTKIMQELLKAKLGK